VSAQEGAGPAKVAEQILVGEALGCMRFGREEYATDWGGWGCVGCTGEDVVDEGSEAEDWAQFRVASA
jgi:hypothetical protein